MIAPTEPLDQPRSSVVVPGNSSDVPSPTRARPIRSLAGLAWLLAIALCVAHGWALYQSMGGWNGIRSAWPLARHDHPIWVHTTWIAPRLIARSGTDAGYDPSFMAGYPKSVIFPQAAAYFELFSVLTRPLGLGPVQTHKLAVFAGSALPPWLVLLACLTWGFAAPAALAAVGLFLIYVWTDGGGAGFPLNYAYYGMIPYLVSIPLAVLALALLDRWLEKGGRRSYTLVVLTLSLTWLVHLTTPMVLAPAGLAAYFARVFDRSRPPLGRWSHAGFWGLPLLIAGLNLWWWLPGLALAGTKGDSGFAFSHSGESVLGRIGQIGWQAPMIQAVLLALVPAGIAALWPKRRATAAGLGVLALAGFAWGYLAGTSHSLDLLQPGRHTYALFVAAAVLGGGVLGPWWNEHRRAQPRWLPPATLAALMLVLIRVFGPSIALNVEARTGRRGGEPFLSSQPTERLRWILNQVGSRMKPGERLLYEESGNDLPGIPDPFQGGRYSGLIPLWTGVEVIGGPYLRSAVVTNHVQFGEGKLLGQENWGTDDFKAACENYGPSAILCWSPHAVSFCRTHPELVEVLAEQEETMRVVDPRTRQLSSVSSRLVFARIGQPGGPVLRGSGRVSASPGSIRVIDARGDELDGLVVLRYHLTPLLRSRPSVRLVPVSVAGDPVPLIGFEPPTDGTVEFDLNPPP